METEKLVTIKQYNQIMEAHIIKSKLEAEGINCFLQDESLVSINWLYANAIGGVKLQVCASDVEKAIKIINEEVEIKVDLEKEQNESMSNDSCLQCNSKDIYCERFSKKRLVLWLLLIPFLPFFNKKYKCYSCNYEWDSKMQNNRELN